MRGTRRYKRVLMYVAVPRQILYHNENKDKNKEILGENKARGFDKE